MSLMRTPEMEEAYSVWKKEHPGETGCFLCEREPKVACGAYWKIVSNDFPYDAVASVSDLLAPMRHFGKKHDMTAEEEAELSLILQKMDDGIIPGYNALLENFANNRTHKSHYHIHCIAIKN